MEFVDRPLADKARKIYDVHLAPGAPSAVNVSAKSTRAVLKALDAGAVPASVFEKATAQLLTVLVQNDKFRAYGRWCETEEAVAHVLRYLSPRGAHLSLTRRGDAAGTRDDADLPRKPAAATPRPRRRG